MFGLHLSAMSPRLSKHLTCVTAVSAVIFIFMALVFKSQILMSMTASKQTSLIPIHVRKYIIENYTESEKITDQVKDFKFETTNSESPEAQEVVKTSKKGTTLEPGYTGGRDKWMELWSRHYNNTRNLPKGVQIYKTALNLADAELTLTLLQILTTMMELHNITYFIYGGTLLGSLRHHGTIPWDDDTDILVDFKHRNKLRDIMQQFKPDYLLHSPNRFTTWKFFSKKSRPTLNIHTQKWKWPFIDIFFFKRKKNVIKDVSWAGNNVIYPQKLIFPLSKRPYAFMNLYAPCDSYAFVTMNYNLSECVSRDWDHSKELKIAKRTQTIHCDTLRQYYPFVYRRNSGKDVTENLMLKEIILQTRVLPRCKYKHDE